MVIDRKAFPRVADYLDALPEGIGSHPGCQTKASGYRASLESRPLAEVALGGLPAPLGDLVRVPAVRNDWIPEVHAMAMGLAIADHHAMSDRLFLDWIYEVNRALLGGSTYGFLMTGGSGGADPRRHSQLRWKQLHRGVELERKESLETSSRFAITFPRNLFSELLLLAFCRSFQASIELACARGARVELDGFNELSAQFSANWS